MIRWKATYEWGYTFCLVMRFQECSRRQGPKWNNLGVAQGRNAFSRTCLRRYQKWAVHTVQKRVCVRWVKINLPFSFFNFSSDDSLSLGSSEHRTYVRVAACPYYLFRGTCHRLQPRTRIVRCCSLSLSFYFLKKKYLILHLHFLIFHQVCQLAAMDQVANISCSLLMVIMLAVCAMQNFMESVVAIITKIV